jgi:hypothetical protein
LAHHTHTAHAAVDYTSAIVLFQVVDEDDEGMVMHLRKLFEQTGVVVGSCWWWWWCALIVCV